MNTISDTDVLAAKEFDSENAIDRMLVLEMVRVTEAAAVAAAQLIGRGDEKAADAAGKSPKIMHKAARKRVKVIVK